MKALVSDDIIVSQKLCIRSTAYLGILEDKRPAATKFGHVLALLAAVDMHKTFEADDTTADSNTRSDLLK